jgi:RimJ/RimL family protein N-acetyltransferase
VLDLNRARWREGKAATFAICAADDGCVGHVFVNLSSGGRGSIGYWLLPEARGRGFATRAVRLVARWALRELGLARLQLLAEPSNEASQRVAERSGFTREGVLRSYTELDGRRLDYVMFSLLPGDES